MEHIGWWILGILVFIFLFFVFLFYYVVPKIIDGMQNEKKEKSEEEKLSLLKKKFESRLLLRAYNEPDTVVGGATFRKLCPRFCLNYDHSFFGYFNSFKTKPEEICCSSCEIYYHFSYMEKHDQLIHKNYMYLWDGINSINTAPKIQVVLISLSNEGKWIMSTYPYKRWSFENPPDRSNSQVIIKIPNELYDPD